MAAEKSDAILIKEFFMADMKSAEALAELRQLTAEDKVQLGTGIRNGSFTY